MNVKEIREIVKIFTQSDLHSLEVQEGEERIQLVRQSTAINSNVVTQCSENPVVREKSALKAEISSASVIQSQDAGLDFNQITEVKSPMVGVFYAASEPGAKPFVQVGDRVKKGDVLCLVEVMKQNSEITALRDGEIADICVQDGSVVEYGQTLFKLY